jgi:hypothetical protein
MAITYSNVQVTKVLTLRGNTIQNDRYTGLSGELTVDTEAKTIRIHDGVTPGGNTVQGGGGASSYGNANVKVYLTNFDGNIVPSANVTYTLGNITHQWRDLFVSNNTIYVGGVPLSIDATGNLTVNGNIIPTIGYVNAQVANVVVDLSAYALNANVTAANVGLKGYVDQANSIQSSAISSANIAIKGYIDQQITDLIGGAPSILDTLNEIAASINDDANVYTSLINSIATANTALKGYVDQANTIQSSQLTSANLGIIGYVDQANTIQSAQVGAANLAITAANVGMRGYVDFANTTMKAYVDGQIIAANANVSSSGGTNYSNVNVKAYTETMGFQNYGDANVGTYLSNYAGRIGNTDAVNINFSGINLVLRPDASPSHGYIEFQGKTVWAQSSIQLNGNTDWDGWDEGSDADVIEFLPNGADRYVGIPSANYRRRYTFINNSPTYSIYLADGYVANGPVVYELKPNTVVTLVKRPSFDNPGDNPGGWLVETEYGNVKLSVTTANIGMRGYVDSQSFYSNAKVATYLQSGNIANISAAGNITATYFVGNGALLTGIVSGGGGGTNYSNVNTAAYLGANYYITSNTANLSTYAWASNVTTANLGIIGYIDQANTIQSAQVGAANLAITAANVGIKGYIDQANSIQSAQVGAANLAITTANVGMRGYVDSQSFYSNAKVATYLPTYNGNIAANISKAGYTWTFGTNGTTQFPNSLILAPVSQSITMQSDQYSQLMWQNANVTVAPNMATYSNFYVGQNNATLDIGYRDGSSNEQFKEWLWTVDGNLTLPSGGYILNSDNSIYGGSSYSNVQVATYLQSGNIANISVAGNVTATYFVGNGALLTGIVGGASNYGNVDVKAFLGTAAGFADGYQRKIEGYYANVILGDTTKLFSFGNSSKSYFGHDGFLGNASINYIRADNADVRIATNNGAYAWIFDRYGNLTLSGNTFSVNYANGTPVTFSSSSYSNVQVATYLPTYSGNVSALNFVGAIQAQVGSSFTYATDAFGSLYNSGQVFLTADNNSNAIVAGYTIVGNSGAVTLTVTSATVVEGSPNFVQVATTPTASNFAYPVTVYTANYSPALPLSTITVGNATVSGNVTAQYFLGNGAFLTGIVASGGSGTNYSNVNVKAYTESMGFTNFSNVNVAALITTNGLTNYSNVNVSALITTNGLTNFSNVNVKAYAESMGFQNYGNVNVAAVITTNGLTNYSNVNIAAYLNSQGYNLYSNVNVASYLGTGQVTVSNIKLAASGNIVFADGTVLNSASTIGGNYSNVNVAVYLPTYGGTIQSSNVQTTTANIQSTTAATNPATGALRVMGGVGVAGAVVAAQLNSTGNLIANAISAYSLNTVANVTASVVNAGTINSSGNVLAQNLIGTIATASQTNITAVGTLATLSVSGNATVGNLVGSEANTRIIANVYTTTFDIYGNVSFPGNIITPTGLYVGPTLFTALPNTIAQFTANANAYAQINFENLSSGTDATADYIATANNGTDTTFFVDLGITNNNYDNASPTNSLGTAVFANDSYLYAQGNLATTTGGNLVIGTSTPNKSVKIFAGGINSADIIATVSNTGVAVTGNVSATNFVGNGTLLTGVAIKTTGSWTVPTGNSTQSFTVPASGTYQLWVDCNIPNGILAWNATATVTNTNVPVIGAQYAWVYNGGGTPVDFTSIPNQFVGTGNTIVRSSVAPSATTNRFDFGINNTSGGNITVRYGYVSIS